MPIVKVDNQTYLNTDYVGKIVENAVSFTEEEKNDFGTAGTHRSVTIYDGTGSNKLYEIILPMLNKQPVDDPERTERNAHTLNQVVKAVREQRDATPFKNK